MSLGGAGLASWAAVWLTPDASVETCILINYLIFYFSKCFFFSYFQMSDFFCSCCLELGTALEDKFRVAVHEIGLLEYFPDDEKKTFPGNDHVIFDPCTNKISEDKISEDKSSLFAQFSPFSQLNQSTYSNLSSDRQENIEDDSSHLRTFQDFNLTDAELKELNALIQKSISPRNLRALTRTNGSVHGNAQKQRSQLSVPILPPEIVET